MDPWFHGEVLVRWLDERPGKSVLILMPRGTGKTSLITQPRPAWWLAQDPTEGVIVANARDERAQKMVRSTAQIISSNERYRLCFPYVKPSNKWGESGYYLDTQAMQEVIPLVSFRVDAALNAFGYTGNITGSHVGGALVVDDLINQAMAESLKQMTTAEKFFIEAQNCVDPGNPQIIIGTRWHPADFYGKIETGELKGNDGQMDVLKIGHLDREGNYVFPARTYFDLKGKERQVGHTREFIEGAKQNLGRLFSANYDNEPVTDEDSSFDLAAIKTFPSIEDLPFELGPVLCLGIEMEAQGKAIMTTVYQVMKDEQRTVRVRKLSSREIFEGAPKIPRIKATLQGYVAEHKFNILECLWRGSGNIGEEMRFFGQVKSADDALDALTYATTLAPETIEGQRPFVVICCDPAYSSEAGADSSAIVACCKFRGELYVLDCHKMKTERADLVVKMLFRMYDKFNKGFKLSQNPKKHTVVGLRQGSFAHVRQPDYDTVQFSDAMLLEKRR